MANLVNVADGNFTAAATWGLVDAALVSTNTGSTALTVAAQDSATFVPTANALIGVVLRLASRAAGAPTNTITVTLRNSTTATDIQSVTANVSDLPVSSTGNNSEGGWHFFKFNASHTPNGTDNYVIRVSLSATTTAVSLATNGTAANWQRLLVRSTTQAPAAGDDMWLAQTLDGSTNPATVTARSVTMDSTAATDYGSAVASIYQPALSVSKACTLAYGTTAATNYILRISGLLSVYSAGIFRIGSAGAEIPRNSSAILEFDNASDGQFGLRCLNGSTFNAHGLSRTAGKDVWMCKLSADEAAASTTIDVDTDTGWLNGDEVLIAGTRRAVENESRTLNANAGATSFTISAGLTNPHLGSGDYFGEVWLLSRNVEIRSVSTTAMTYCHFQATATVSVKWTLFRYYNSLGQSFDIGTTTGSLSFQYVVLRHGEIGNSFAASHNNISFDKVLIHDIGGIGNALTINSTTGTYTFTDVAFTNCPNCLNLLDVGGTFSNLWFVGNTGDEFIWGENRVLNDGTGGPTFVGGSVWTFHSNTGGAGSSAMAFSTHCTDITFPTIKMWRCACDPISLAQDVCFHNVEFTGEWYGNGVATEEPGVMLLDGTINAMNDVRFVNSFFSGDDLFAANWAFLFDKNNIVISDMYWYNCKFSENAGTRRPFAVADIGCIPDVDAGGMTLQGVAEWCSFGAPESVKFYYSPGPNPRYASKYSYVICPGYGQVATAHRVYQPHCTHILDTTTFDVTPSQNMKNLSTNVTGSMSQSNAHRRGTGFLVAVNNGGTVTPSVKVQINAGYNGSTMPQLVVLRNRALGINNDTVLDTHNGISGVWDTLSGTTAAVAADGVLEFVIRSYGSAGDAWVDTWSTSASGQDTTGVRYWNGQSVTYANTSGGGGGGGEHSAVF